MADTREALPPSAIGGCLCGAVSVQCSKPPVCAQYCHCRQCRKAHGAPFVSWTGFPTESFTVTGSEHVRWRSVSSSCRRGWCESCGTPLFMDYDIDDPALWPEVSWVSTGSLDEVDLQPQCHIYVDDAAEWNVDWPGPNLPRFGGPMGLTEVLDDGTQGRLWSPSIFKT